MSYVKLPPAPIRQEYGTYAWIDWWNKVRDYSQNTFYVADSAFTGLSSKLNRDAADVLGGTITFNSLGAFKVGSVTWNGTSATGTGVMFTENGIVGANGGSIKFAIKSDGTATFGGQLTAAFGSFGAVSVASTMEVANTGAIYSTGKTSYSSTTAGFWLGYDSTAYKFNIGDGTKYLKWSGSSLLFAGDMETTGHVVAHGTSSAEGYTATIIAAPTFSGDAIVGVVVADIGVTGYSDSGIGGKFTGYSGGYGVFAQSAGVAVSARKIGSGTALEVMGPMTIDNSTLVTNLNADKVDGYHAGNSNGNVPVSNGTINTNLFAEFSSKLQATGNTFQFKNGRSTGSQTPTAIPNNKPGTTSGSVAWLTINIDGTDYYVPSWTA